MLKALKILKENSNDILRISKISDEISGVNYVTTKKRYTYKFVKKVIERYTPVTTEPIPKG